MLTKALKFDDDVLSIIQSMDWQDNGRLGILTCGQLERRLYQRMNKALSAMGGKWNRSRGGHIFSLDPRPLIHGLVESGTLVIERDGFFETPPEVVDRMIELIWPKDRILEPSAGLGAIADRLPINRASILCIERNERRVAELQKKGYDVLQGDFLAIEPGMFCTIYMNPPFEQGQDIDHVRHAFECLAPGGTLVSVMSEGTFFRNDCKATAFRNWAEQVDAHIEQLLPKSFKASGTNVNARLIVIHRPG